MNKNFWSIKKSLVNKEKSDILLQENTLIPISSIEMIVIRILFGIDILFSIPLSEIFYKLKIILYSN